MPELTYKNVDSLESRNSSWTSRNEALIYKLFSAINDEENTLNKDGIIQESEHYDTITCRNDDWPEFCLEISVRRYKEDYFLWSIFLGENGAWITMPQDLIEEITGKAD